MLYIEQGRRCIWLNGRMIRLPKKEYLLLCLFIETPFEVVENARILQHVWQTEYKSENLVRQLVSGLRKQLEDEAGTEYISTVHGKGYQFVGSFKLGIPPINNLRRLTKYLFRRKSKLVILPLMAIIYIIGYEMYSSDIATPKISESKSFYRSAGWRPVVSPSGQFLAEKIYNSGQNHLAIQNIESGENIVRVDFASQYQWANNADILVYTNLTVSKKGIPQSCALIIYQVKTRSQHDIGDCSELFTARVAIRDVNMAFSHDDAFVYVRLPTKHDKGNYIIKRFPVDIRGSNKVFSFAITAQHPIVGIIPTQTANTLVVTTEGSNLSSENDVHNDKSAAYMINTKTMEHRLITNASSYIRGENTLSVVGDWLFYRNEFNGISASHLYEQQTHDILAPQSQLITSISKVRDKQLVVSFGLPLQTALTQTPIKKTKVNFPMPKTRFPNFPRLIEGQLYYTDNDFSGIPQVYRWNGIQTTQLTKETSLKRFGHISVNTRGDLQTQINQRVFINDVALPAYIKSARFFDDRHVVYFNKKLGEEGEVQNSMIKLNLDNRQSETLFEYNYGVYDNALWVVDDTVYFLATKTYQLHSWTSETGITPMNIERVMPIAGAVSINHDQIFYKDLNVNTHQYDLDTGEDSILADISNTNAQITSDKNQLISVSSQPADVESIIVTIQGD